MSMMWNPFNGIAFRYDPFIDYINHSFFCIGRMSQTCRYCDAVKWELIGMCCSNGKVRLPLPAEKIEPLKTLVIGETAESRCFYTKFGNITHASK